ncbi:copper resistance CopC family protein, partial [Aquipuribacter hungaricus]
MPTRATTPVTSPDPRDRRAPAARHAAVALVAPLVLLLSLVVAGPASAHARFTGSDPAEGSQVDALPAAVVMSYSEEIAPQFVEAAVVAPDGTTVPTTSSAAGTDVTVDLGGEVAAAADQTGTWQVVARVVSVDGHPVEHTTSFVLTAAAAPPAPAEGTTAAPTAGTTGEATPEATSEAAGATDAATGVPADQASTEPVSAVTDGLPRWALVVGALVLVAAAAAALVVQLR